MLQGHSNRRPRHSRQLAILVRFGIGARPGDSEEARHSESLPPACCTVETKSSSRVTVTALFVRVWLSRCHNKSTFCVDRSFTFQINESVPKVQHRIHCICVYWRGDLLFSPDSTDDRNTGRNHTPPILVGHMTTQSQSPPPWPRPNFSRAPGYLEENRRQGRMQTSSRPHRKLPLVC